jgi:competence protein ComEC
MRYLTPLLAAALLTGMFAGTTIDASSTFGVTLVASAAWAAAMLATLRRLDRLQLVAAAVLAAAAGWMLGASAVDRAHHSPVRMLLEQRLGGFALDAFERRLDEPVIIEGRLLADAAPTDDGAVVRVGITRVTLHGVGEPASGGVSLGIGGELHDDAIGEWRAGRLIRAPVLLRRPARYLNAGLPDQERVLARRGVSLVGTIKSAALVEVVQRGRWWDEAAASIRARTRAAITRHVAPYAPQSAAIAIAILIGDRAGLAFDTERRLQEAGTYHVIAISGGNIAILAALLLGIMAVAGVHGRLAALVAIVGLSAYGLIAAGGASVARATVMAVVYLAVRLIDQRTSAAHAMALTASIIVIVNPLQILDVGFWFTFGATMALITAATFVGTAAPTHHFSIRGVAVAAWLVFLSTACVELVLAPIAALVFQRVTLAGLALNFAALPAMTVVQLSAMGVLAADVLRVPLVADWCAFAAHLGAAVLVDSAGLLDYAPWLTWRVPSPAAIVMTTYYAALCAAVAAWFGVGRVPRAIAAVVTMVACTLFVWIIAAPPAHVRALGDGQLHVSMIDVGQGDSVLVTFPNGRRLLVDTGGLPRGTFDIGDRVVGPTLRAAQLLRLDYLAVTHGDSDHAAGARSLIRDFTPHEVWWGIPVANHELTATLRVEATRQRAAWRTLQRGDELAVGDVVVRVHHPTPPDWERQRIRNNDSLVIELRFGRVSVLLTGDIDREVEDALLPTLDLLPTVVLKVAHHGSLTSSSHRFVSALRPAVALIGVGRGNVYGHPAPYVLGRLQDAGAEIFRTDLDGQVSVSSDGEQLWVRTFSGRTLTLRGQGSGIGDQGSVQ